MGTPPSRTQGPRQHPKQRDSALHLAVIPRGTSPASPAPPRGSSAWPHLISAGPSPARSRRWTASRPPWRAARTRARLASRRTRRPRHSLWSPGRCCTSAGPLASLGTLPGDTEEKREVTTATGQEGGGPSAGQASQTPRRGHTYGPGPTVPSTITQGASFTLGTYTVIETPAFSAP